MKILIVDDEMLIRELLIQVIESFDDTIEILEASNGLEGLEMIRQEKPDIVFLDLMMPKISGFDLCRILQNEPPSWKMDIVVISAKGQEIDKKIAYDLGVVEYITKPFKVDKIIEVIQKLSSK
ncbi:MAG: response regulator [Thermodesulfovibrionales bacterium]|nr:response regulator [Thermodesulfovibrionales bacterium]